MSDRDLICYIIGAVTEGILIIVERPREEYLNHIPEKYLGDLVDKLEIAEDY